jgi:uncharacterized protein
MFAETALITGASFGIGLELARLFAADRSDLVLVARSQDRLEALADELGAAHGTNVRVIARDLAESAAPQSIYDALRSDGTIVDVLVNNAGFGAVGAVAELGLERQLDMLQVNVTALVHLTRLFLPDMLKRNRGGILNVGSIAGFQPGPNMAMYYASKAFVLSFTEALAEELVGTSVHASVLAPGPTATEFGARSGMDRSPVFRLGAMNAAPVARAGYDGFRRGRKLVIPGIQNKVLAQSARFSPRLVVRKVAKRLNG